MADTEKSAHKAPSHKPLNERKDNEERLDEGLKESFPASDPVAANQPTRTGAPDEFKKDKKDKKGSQRED